MTPLIKWTAIICTVLFLGIMIYLCDYCGLEERNALKVAIKREHDITTYLLKIVEQKMILKEAIIERYGVEFWERLWRDTIERYK